MKINESLGRPQKASTRRKISKKLKGKNNGMYKDGRRSYRRIAGTKTNDGSIIHHKNGDRTDNRKSNLVKVPKSKRGEHDKAHNRGKNFRKSGGTKKGAHTKKSKPKRWKLKGYKKKKKKKYNCNKKKKKYRCKKKNKK